eukprot:TRINITY_DN4703_c0_g1_i1.p1 TRINITY_DN4703_c0_g1~~TRINITY_DN4703_c0_g1_i1.p1  ORF type:complete len:397 (+),score=94.46 TRINITY_DN4703_c0_g1_i1:210-1400(+)
MPKAVFPSAVGVMTAVPAPASSHVGAQPMAIGDDGPLYRVGTSELWVRRDNMDIKYPMQDGLVRNWDVYEQLCRYAFDGALRVKSDEHPVMLCEPSVNTKINREKMTEIMFETFSVPAMFMYKNAVLAAFANGRSTALVVDSGGAGTVVTPVHEGYALGKGVQRSDVGGDFITRQLYHALTQTQVKIRAKFEFTRKAIGNTDPPTFSLHDLSFPATLPSYTEWRRLDVVRDIKETVCRVADSRFDQHATLNAPGMQYDLPDGTSIEVGQVRFSEPETLFRTTSGPGGHPRKSITEMMQTALSSSDADGRREMMSSIVLTGGNTLIPGFVERMSKECGETFSQTKIKLYTSATPQERRCGTWIGGSILASLGTFQQMWMSKAEYAEHGKTLVERKCP